MLDSLFRMRLFRVLAVLLILEVCFAAQPPRSPRKPTAASLDSAHPNIILITLDTTRADRMGFLGSKRGLTPNLDAMAKQGIAFSRAYSHVPIGLKGRCWPRCLQAGTRNSGRSRRTSSAPAPPPRCSDRSSSPCLRRGRLARNSESAAHDFLRRRARFESSLLSSPPASRPDARLAKMRSISLR